MLDLLSHKFQNNLFRFSLLWSALLTIVVSGCAANLVSLNQWRSRVTLIDSKSNIYEGNAIFHWTYRDGTIEILSSAYGKLEGRFSTQTPSVSSYTSEIAAAAGRETIVVPSLSSQSIQLGNSIGTVYLANDGKVVLRCNIGVDFKTMGWGDAQMVGGGVCADSQGNVSHILFGR